MSEGYKNVLVLGGSKNIGYYTAMRLLALGSTVTFLLRSPAVFDNNEEIGPYIKSGKAIPVKGDGLRIEDVKNCWDKAASNGPVDVVLSTVGGTPTFHPTKGVIITPANCVTQCVLNLLCTIPSPTVSQPRPRLVMVSSTGLTHTSYKELPCLLKPVYGYLLALPHKDKVGAERVISHCAGWTWNTKEDGEPDEEITGNDWASRQGLPAPGTLKNILVVRPAWLTDGECKAESTKGNGYRVGEQEIGGYTVSRKDVAHFIAGAVTENWAEYHDKRISIAY